MVRAVTVNFTPKQKVEMEMNAEKTCVKNDKCSSKMAHVKIAKILPDNKAKKVSNVVVTSVLLFRL